LVLAGSYNDEDPRVYTSKAAYISLLKAPPSWALTANIVPMQWQQDKENTTEASKISLQCQREKEITTEAPNTPQGQKENKKILTETNSMPKEVVQQQDRKENTTEAAEIVPQRQQYKENDDDASISGSAIHVNVPSVYARCASGVPFLMSAVDEKAVISRRLDSPPTSTRILSRWGLCRHLFFGNFASEDNCTQSPLSERVS
jgi:hypothetical protein